MLSNIEAYCASSGQQKNVSTVVFFFLPAASVHPKSIKQMQKAKSKGERVMRKMAIRSRHQGKILKCSQQLYNRN